MKLLCLAAALAATAPLPQARSGEPERPWTLMIYGAADNNADGPILHFLDDIRSALDDDPGMELLLFIDRSEGFSDDAESLGADFTGARVYRLRRDEAELLDASEFFPGMNADAEYEVDSADPRNIGAFVAFGKARFPARHYGLMIYSHADGCTMCPDEEAGTDMSIPQLTDEVGEEASVDFLALELCNMGGIEIAYQWRPGNGGFSADVLVAIPNAGPPLDWDRAFQRIRSEGHVTTSPGRAHDPAQLTPTQFGRLVVEEGYAGRMAMLERNRDRIDELPPEEVASFLRESAACYDLTKTAAAKRAIDELAMALADTDAKQAFEALRDGEGDRVMNYTGDEFDARPYVDAYALLSRAAASEDLHERARAAAAVARDAIDDVVVASFGMEGHEGFVDGKHGIFLVFPDGDAEESGPFGTTRNWGRFAWYTPLDADGPDRPYGRWAFLLDGATPGNGEVDTWFELLDAWYDDTSDGPEGLNRYAY